MQKQVQKPWYQQPIWLGLLGLLIMLLGWKLSIYKPYSNAIATVAELQQMTEDQELVQRLDQVARAAPREPPYKLPGLMAFLAGMMMFISAGVAMYQSPPILSTDESEPESEP